MKKVHECKSANIFVFILKWYVKDFTLNYLLLSELSTCEIGEKIVYKRSKSIE